MADETKAGALLISQIGMFNEAVIHWNNVVEPAILSAIDQRVKDFAENNGFDGEFDLAESDNCWIAPPSWKIAAQDEKPAQDEKLAYKAWIEIGCTDDSGDFWTALFCTQGSNGDEAGFIFDVNAKSEFNGQKAWNAYAAKIEADLVKDLEVFGYKYLGKGKFFMPVHLDATQLAEAWEAYGTDGNLADDDCFEPIINVLEKIKESIPTFENIMENFNIK